MRIMHRENAPLTRGADPMAGAWGLVFAVLFLMVGNGLLASLIGIRAEINGFGIGVTGVIVATYYLGFLGGARVVPRFVRSVGHIRVYAALASLASSAAIAHAVTASPVVWGGLRFLTGFCFAGLYIVAESWLNGIATSQTRGRLLSVYMIVVMGGIGAGQLLLSIADPGAAGAFVMASVLLSVAVLPITLSVGEAPQLPWADRLPARRIWASAPTGLVAAFGVGMANGAILALGAVYGTRAGMSVQRIAIFMGLLLLGSVLLQWPIGSVSDRVSRRVAILAVTMLAAVVAILATLVDPLGPLMLMVSFLFGGLTFPLYSLALSHINDQAPASGSISVSSLFVFVSGAGAVAGPLVASWAMAATGPDGLFWTLALVHIAIGVFAGFRIAGQRESPLAGRPHSTLVPARVGAVAVHLARMARGNRDSANDR